MTIAIFHTGSTLMFSAYYLCSMIRKEVQIMFRDTSKPITLTDIKGVESELGIRLPDSFIEHYLAYNGGIPLKPFFYSEKTDIETEIQIFLPLKYKFSDIDMKTIEEKYIFFKKKSKLMADYMPFANDYGSNQICMNLKDGKIYIVYMDIGELGQKCFQYLANDFSEFLSGLSEESMD